MGSATGYTGPTAEEPADGGDGRPLLEVFSLRLVDRAAPCGTVSVSDGRRGQIIYSRERDQLHPSSRAQDGLVLTVPYRAISAEWSVAITVTLDLDDGSQPSSEDEEISKLLLDGYDPSPTVEYDKAVNTRCGPVEVTYAVLSNAVEGFIEVKLKLVHGGEGDGGVGVGGRIIARSQLSAVGIGAVLLDSEPPPQGREGTSSTIPLLRSVLAVPLGWPLTVEVDLRGSSGDEIAKGCLEFYPELEGEHVKRLVGSNGNGEIELEVKITWWEIDL